jgi:hypothetical protein
MCNSSTIYEGGANYDFKWAILVLVDMLQNMINQIEQIRIEIPGIVHFFWCLPARPCLQRLRLS